MEYQYHPYVWLIIASSAITLFLGIYAIIRRRHSKGAATFALTMMMMTAWSVIYILVFSSADLSARIFWNNVIYIPVGFTPILFLALCMEFAGYDDWIYSKKILWFTIWPVIFFLIKWTDVRYGLVYYDMHMEHIGTYMILAKKYGPIYYINVIYILLLNLASFTLLIRGLFFKNTVYRRQSFSLLAALFLPHIPYAYFLYTKSSLLIPLDATILFFGPTGLTLAWGIFRLKLFDLVPVARATVIETMDAGVMVMDLQNRIIDVNPAFQSILGRPAASINGQDVESVCGSIQALAGVCKDWNITETEFCVNDHTTSRDYQLLVSPLTDNRGILIGRLAISYDITEKKRVQQEYLKQQWRLAVIEERERMARDLHDNLGQIMGYINLQTQGIRQELLNAGMDIASHRLDKLIDVTQSANNDIRQYIQNARNLSSMEKDFVSVLTRELLIFEERTGVNVIVDLPTGFTGEELELDAKLNLLSIVKEALNNVIKHSGAQNVKISLAFVQTELCAAIEDDGRGFDVISWDKDDLGGFGLKIMQERAYEIGAKIDIQSTVGNGSRIALRIPAGRGGANT